MKKAIIAVLSFVLILALFTSCEEPEHEHTWNEGEVTTAATCTEKGVKTFTCTVCKETKTEELPVDPKNHTWDKGEVTTAATCTEKGVKTFTCTACKETKTEAVNALGHDNVAKNTVEPGYLSKGYTEYKCSRCNVEETVYSEQKDINGVWLQTEMNIDEESCTIFLALQNDKENPSNGVFSLYLKTKDAMPIEGGSEDLYYYTNKLNEDAYSLELGENPKITVPYNGTKNQTCDISEVTDSEGVTKITVKDIALMSPTPETIVFTVVPSHTFSDVPDLTKAIVNKDGTHSVYSCYICTCEHTKDEIRLLLFIEDKTE